MKDFSAQRVTVPALLQLKANSLKHKICALTAYDFSMASILDQAGIDILLVGDSLGTVIQGHATTLPVTLDEVIYHSRCVARGVRRALVVGDMPFMSYQSSIERALESAGRLVKEGGVGAVKLEGGVPMAETISRLAAIDIPVMGHIGLTPQSFHRMGGYKTQGLNHGDERKSGTYERILQDARAIEEAGAFAVVIEGVPGELAAEITSALSIPTIGIGAGPDCDGQILVTQDMLGMNLGHLPSFVRKFAELGKEIEQAVKLYHNEIQAGTFPLRRPALSKVARER